MDPINTAALREQLAPSIGPAPWYWKTFPTLRLNSGQRAVWEHHGEQGALAHIVSLAPEANRDQPWLALNTYTRAFPVGADRLGIWCPEGRNLRFTCFDPGNMKPFDFAEIAGWFPPSSERIYAATEPLCDFELPVNLAAGMHKLEVPPELRQVDELIVPTTYPEHSPADPAMALFVVYFQAGLVEVLPQRWFTAAQYQVGRQWITRVARDKQSHRIFGECFGVGSFLLEEDGVRLERWIDKV
jgi:hypothetical protein